MRKELTFDVYGGNGALLLACVGSIGKPAGTAGIAQPQARSRGGAHAK